MVEAQDAVATRGAQLVAPAVDIDFRGPSCAFGVFDGALSVPFILNAITLNILNWFEHDGLLR